MRRVRKFSPHTLPAEMIVPETFEIPPSSNPAGGFCSISGVWRVIRNDLWSAGEIPFGRGPWHAAC